MPEPTKVPWYPVAAALLAQLVEHLHGRRGSTVRVRQRASRSSANGSLLHPRIVRRVGVHGRATVIDGFGAQFVVPGFVAVDLAQPVLGAVLGQPRRGIGGPDVDRVARHVSRRARGGHPSGSFRFRAVLRDRLTESCSWYSGERQPLSTKNSTPSYAASVAAWRRAPSRSGSRLATPGISSSKTVVPSGTAPSASPSAPRCSLRRHGAHCEGRRWVMRPSRTRTPATGSRGLRRSPR